ncbi:hypothetical protein YQE_06286, partial [Dendroctonus ponderosae]
MKKDSVLICQLKITQISASIGKRTPFRINVGVSRALSAFRAVLDTKEADNLNSVGTNPFHEKHLGLVKLLALKRRRLSRISRIVSRNQNLGVKKVKWIFPKWKQSVKDAAKQDIASKEGVTLAWVH